MTRTLITSAIGLSAIIMLTFGCLYSKPISSSPSQVAIEEPSTQELFDAYLESLRNVAHKEGMIEKIGKKFEDHRRQTAIIKSRVQLAKANLTKYAREAARAKNDTDSVALVQEARRELEESTAELQAQNERYLELGDPDSPYYEHMRAKDESEQAYEKFFEKASRNRPALSELQSISKSYMRRTFELEYLISVRNEQQSEESKAVISAYEKALDSLIKAELACEKAFGEARAIPDYKDEQKRFEELLGQLPADGSALSENQLSALEEQGRKLDLIEDDYKSKWSNFDTKYADLKAAQEAYNQAFIDMVVKTTR